MFSFKLFLENFHQGIINQLDSFIKAQAPPGIIADYLDDNNFDTLANQMRNITIENLREKAKEACNIKSGIQINIFENANSIDWYFDDKKVWTIMQISWGKQLAFFGSKDGMFQVDGLKEIYNYYLEDFNKEKLLETALFLYSHTYE